MVSTKAALLAAAACTIAHPLCAQDYHGVLMQSPTKPAEAVAVEPNVAEPIAVEPPRPHRLPLVSPVAVEVEPIPAGAVLNPAAALLNRPLGAVSLDSAPADNVASKSVNLLPENRIRDLAAESGLNAGAPLFVTADSRRFGGFEVDWAAPALRHRPLLLEQPNVERYGHYVGLWAGDNLSQSALSAAHFFGGIAATPYWVGAQGHHECEYTLGVYRPGSCNPHQVVTPRWSAAGLATQAAATTGLVFLIP